MTPDELPPRTTKSARPVGSARGYDDSMAGRERYGAGRIVVFDHDPAWAAMFERERARVQQALGPIVVTVEPFGGSAAPAGPRVLSGRLETASVPGTADRQDLLRLFSDA